MIGGNNCRLSRGFARAGKLEDALEKSQRVIARWPHFHFAHAEQAKVFVEMGRYEEALSCRKGSAIMPRKPAILTTHAHVLLHLGLVEEALSRYAMGARLKPAEIKSYAYTNIVRAIASVAWHSLRWFTHGIKMIQTFGN